MRTSGNQRRYERATLRRVAFIRSAQRVGLTLEEITAALHTLPGGRTPTKADWTRLSRQWRGRINEQIEQAGAAARSIGQLHRLRLSEPAAVHACRIPMTMSAPAVRERSISTHPRTDRASRRRQVS